MNIGELEGIARRIRGKLVEMSHNAGAAHLGSALSCVDILVAVYWSALAIDENNPIDPKRDRFILSKGHAAAALYATLAYRGFFPLELLESFGKENSNLLEHPSPRCVPGVEVATGSLGHGLSLGIGMALSGRIQKQHYRIFVVMSDGECNEGSVWEAAMFAPAQKLDNIMVFVDFNRWQATGRSEEVMAIQPLRQKWEAFGWSTYELNGHDMSGIVSVLANVPDGSGKPIAVVANTIKGKGVSFMEDDNNWHYRIPNENEVKVALEELGLL